MNALNLKKKKVRAFTLVELVVVIVILGILVAIAGLSYFEFQQKAKEEVAKTNLRVIKSSVIMYRIDHNGDYPDNLLSTPGAKDGLDYYLDNELNKILTDPSEPYKYLLSNEADKLTLTVTGPNSFKEEIVIPK